MRLQNKKITLTLTTKARDYIVENSYDEKYGARPLKRTIQNLLEDQLAEAVLEGTVREGDTVDVTVLDGQLKFSAVHPQTAGKTPAGMV